MNLAAWQRIGTDPTTLQYIADGIRIPFVAECPQFHEQNYCLKHYKEKLFLRNEVKRLLDLGYVKKCESNPGFISPIGCVPKKGDNKFRLIHDLRFLNGHCEKFKFKQEDIRVVQQIIKPKDFLTSIDLKDGFFHIKVHPDHQKYLSFQFDNAYYSFTVLCFGFALSPYFFYKCLRPIVAYLRTLNVRLVLYVDDFLVCSSEATIADDTDTVVHTLEDLGLRINNEKSVLKGSQCIEYLGYTIDTHGSHPVISAKRARVQKIKRLIKQLLKKKSCSARILAKCAGLCVSTAWVVATGKLYLRNIYRLIAKRLSWSDILHLDNAASIELNWWLKNIDKFNEKIIKPNPVTVAFEVDASASGWGAVLGECKAKGDYNEYLSKQSSNYRELTAILLAILAFKHKLKNQHVLVFSDNSTAVAYVNNKGGPYIDLNNIAIKIWTEADRLGLSISCRHLAGARNVQADTLSRTPDRHSWMLHPGLFQMLEDYWGPHTIDRFATFENTQLPRYNSLFWDVGTEAIDAFAQSWSGENNFVNAPWALLPRILEKLSVERADATVIVPQFKAQPWFQRLRQMATCPPINLPVNRRTLVNRGVQPEPLKNPLWRVQAWRISGRKN